MSRGQAGRTAVTGARCRPWQTADVFAVLMDAARTCSLQQITDAFFEVGGQYRRNV
ncbi:hypothetical protein [Streptomyces sp. NPDC056683]|uniref:hypothetical protein n=1 Tax=Streptomyces sp. NPDC056683 TaxID=3345910 RepID=UPI0036AC220E